MKNKVFITGEYGHLGYLIYCACIERGYYVINDKYRDYAKHNKSGIPNVFKYKYFNEIDVLDYNLICTILRDEKPDVIIHTAAYVGTDKCEANYHGAYQANVLAIDNMTRNINYFCKDCLFINFSTTATMEPYKYSMGMRINENTERGPKTWYGQTKLLGEQIVKKNCRKWINLLPVFLFNKYPFDNASIWAKMFIANISGSAYKINLNSNFYKQYEYSENIIDIVFKIIENKGSINKDVIITGTEIKKFSYFINVASKEYFKAFGNRLEYELIPENDYLKNHVADNSLMLKLAKITNKKYNEKRKNFNIAIKEVLESCR